MVSINLASENAGVVESGSEPSNVHWTMPCVDGGDSVNVFLKPASGISVREAACAIMALIESFETLESLGTRAESVAAPERESSFSVGTIMLSRES